MMIINWLRVTDVKRSMYWMMNEYMLTGEHVLRVLILEKSHFKIIQMYIIDLYNQY